MCRWFMGLVMVLVLMGPAYSAEAPPADEPTAVPEAVEKVDVLNVGKETFEQIGAPKDFSVRGIAAYLTYGAIVFLCLYVGKRYKDKEDLVAGMLELDNIADQVYLNDIEGATVPLDNTKLREAGINLARAAGGKAGKLLLTKGPQWVAAYLHNRSNKKKQAGQQAKAASLNAEAALLTANTVAEAAPETPAEDS